MTKRLNLEMKVKGLKTITIFIASLMALLVLSLLFLLYIDEDLQHTSAVQLCDFAEPGDSYWQKHCAQ